MLMPLPAAFANSPGHKGPKATIRLPAENRRCQQNAWASSLQEHGNHEQNMELSPSLLLSMHLGSPFAGSGQLAKAIAGDAPPRAQCVSIDTRLAAAIMQRGHLPWYHRCEI